MEGGCVFIGWVAPVDGTRRWGWRLLIVAGEGRNRRRLNVVLDLAIQGLRSAPITSSQVKPDEFPCFDYPDGEEIPFTKLPTDPN
ncbi:hypothetical protein L2E82_01251 [Cichorium intybus]|uniref:Uncharacterized protein n=1 Tax=Cichorium intybus TaxID=13427 RepID=A0ACB9GY33_CICIN|nr:hypothetical protein L2E82_01251 [Cichorium intybus]